ncbi:MAG TPA: hypothetical protein VIP57_05460 [Candidatus Dormibacteraeota bacterium]
MTTMDTWDGRSNALRLAGLAGILSIGLGVAGVFVDQMETFPGTGSTAGEIASFVNAHRPALLVAMLLNAAGVSLWLVFGAGIWLWLRETTGGESILSACFLLGLASFVTLLLAGFTSFFVLVYRGAESSDPKLLYDLAFGLLAMSGAPTALALGSYAALAIRAEPLPNWTASLAALAAVAHVALLASFVIEDGFFSLEGGVIIAIPATLFAWILGTSVAMKAAARTGASIDSPA